MRILALFCLTLSLFAGAASAHEYTAGSLTIEHPWTRAMPPGAQVGGGFLIITNSGDQADRLVGISSPRAETGQVHEMSMQDGVMKMRHLEDGLEIPAGASIALKPGGYHVMFMGVGEGFKEGEMIPAVLVFEKAGEVPVEFLVGPVGATTPPAKAN
jgi:periplasmic copper chaperone A